ncbi:MAG: hypothetical protein II531_03895 [Bacteroidales bacterium]|nr:hypothetical protein [Bacteroidales bacterium]
MTIDTLVKQSSANTHVGLAGIDTQRLKAMRNASLRECFRRIEETSNRMEFVARVYGREYICDAAARSVNATWYTLESLQGGLIWIADAADGDFSRLIPVALRKVHMLLILGEGGEAMRDAFAGVVPTVQCCSSMTEAIGKACHYEDGDVKVVYSPACHNGMNTADLGAQFRREVNEI